MQQEEALIHIKKTLAGDLPAYARLVEAHRLKAFHLALRIVKNDEDAEEVAQDAFLKAFKGLAKFEASASFSTWLYRIVYNTALSKIRKKKLDTVSMDESLAHVKVEQTERTFAALMEKDRAKYLQLAISRLKEESALMIDLYYYHQKDMHEIAVVMGLNHGQVRVRMTRARKKLRAYLEEVLQKETKDIL